MSGIESINLQQTALKKENNVTNSFLVNYFWELRNSNHIRPFVMLVAKSTNLEASPVYIDWQQPNITQTLEIVVSIIIFIVIILDSKDISPGTG